jgi:hypothetical protein
MVVTFGEEKVRRTGLEKTPDEPALVMATKAMAPREVHAAKNHTILVDDKGELQSTGGGWGGDHAGFTNLKFGKDEEKVAKIFCGPK